MSKRKASTQDLPKEAKCRLRLMGKQLILRELHPLADLIALLQSGFFQKFQAVIFEKNDEIYLLEDPRLHWNTLSHPQLQEAYRKVKRSFHYECQTIESKSMLISFGRRGYSLGLFETKLSRLFTTRMPELVSLLGDQPSLRESVLHLLAKVDWACPRICEIQCLMRNPSDLGKCTVPKTNPVAGPIFKEDSFPVQSRPANPALALETLVMELNLLRGSEWFYARACDALWELDMPTPVDAVDMETRIAYFQSMVTDKRDSSEICERILHLAHIREAAYRSAHPFCHEMPLTATAVYLDERRQFMTCYFAIALQAPNATILGALCYCFPTSYGQGLSLQMTSQKP